MKPVLIIFGRYTNIYPVKIVGPWCSPVNTPRVARGETECSMLIDTSCHLYILQNDKGNFYIGVTTDIDRRLAEHNRGQNTSTKKRGPWRLVYTEKHPSSIIAKRREYEIKQKKRRAYAENLIAHGSVV